MGMTMELCAASDDTIRGLMARPEGIRKFVAGPVPQPGLLTRLFGAKPAPARCDLHKSAFGVHYLLTGEAAEQGNGGDPRESHWLILGGTPVGDVDIGYGPARALDAAQTRRWAAYLAAVDEAEMRARFDPEAMRSADVPPDIWDEEEVLDETMDYFAELREFIQARAQAGDGVLVMLA